MSREEGGGAERPRPLLSPPLPGAASAAPLLLRLHGLFLFRSPPRCRRRRGGRRRKRRNRELFVKHALPPLCVFDFDHTLVCDFDSAEEVVSRLAPELAPMLTSLAMPADFIPLTNAVAAEASEARGQRGPLAGGAGRDRQEGPAGSAKGRRAASAGFVLPPLLAASSGLPPPGARRSASSPTPTTCSSPRCW